jgi:hypothetical protein
VITLTSALAAQFHRDLATHAGMENLRSHVEERIASYRSDYQSAKVAGVVRSQYNETRYMGPNSLVKYEFIVEVTLDRHDAPSDPDMYESSVRYKVETGTFETFQEVFDSKELREGREREALEMKRKRLLARLMALLQFERDMEEFIARSTRAGEQVFEDYRANAPRSERFAHAVLRSCLFCWRDAPSTVYVVERSWSIVFVYRDEHRVVALCPECVENHLLKVGQTLRRFWKVLPETRSPPQSESLQENPIEIDDGEWDTWSIAANGVRTGPGKAPYDEPLRLI